MADKFDLVNEWNGKYEYSGETIKRCQDCENWINEGDEVHVEVYQYKGNTISEVWHSTCWHIGMEFRDG